MKVLSIDVGIKNLAYCLFEKQEKSEHFIIKKWDSINVSESNSSKCGFIEKNGSNNNNNNNNTVMCNKPAKYIKDSQCFCLKHSKKQHYQIPTSELKTTFINKQKIQKLFELADKYKIPYPKPVKKPELIELINEYINKTCFETVVSTNASKVDIVTIGENIKTKFNSIFDEEDMIEHIIIENQISPIANRMKTIQGLITQYFIMKGNYENIEFISAANKLKDFDTNIKDETIDNNKVEKKGGEPNSYNSRKKLGITKCLELITNDYKYNHMLEYFNKHTKKDDLSDSFLQGLWFIKNKL